MARCLTWPSDALAEGTAMEYLRAGNWSTTETSRRGPIPIQWRASSTCRKCSTRCSAVKPSKKGLVMVHVHKVRARRPGDEMNIRVSGPGNAKSQFDQEEVGQAAGTSFGGFSTRPDSPTTKEHADDRDGWIPRPGHHG
eukprot:9463885-Pyramimonas_sp.AAC.1